MTTKNSFCFQAYTNDHLKSMMDIHEPAQEFRHLGVKSTPAPAVSDDDEEMVLNYSDSEDDHSSKVSKNENFKDALDLFDKGNGFKRLYW